MKYSVLGFNQKRVESLSYFEKIKKGDKEDFVEKKLDVVDLLILSYIANFPNFASVKKIIDDGKVFFWASYNKIIEDLPILHIQKHALSLRFEKMEKMKIIEKKFVNVDSKNQNATFFCLTPIFESLLKEKEEGYCNQMQEGTAIKCSTNNNINNNKEIEDKSSIEKGWRIDKSEYIKLIDEAIGELLVNDEYKKQQEELYVNIDYKRTIIACGNYWKDDAQWETYKRKKTKKPNFVSAIKKGFHINKIYKQRYGGNDLKYGYPKSIDDVNNSDVCKTYDFFIEWVDKSCKRLVDGVLKGFPQNNSQYNRLISCTKGGARGLAYVCLVLNRDGWSDYMDDNGFMWIYHKYIVANGMFIGNGEK